MNLLAKPVLPLIRRKSTELPVTPYPRPLLTRKDGSLLKSCFRSISSSECTNTTSFESDGTSVSTSPSQRHRRVTFTHVTIREYCRECGDNPSVSSGPPLSIGWKYHKQSNLDIDSFEADKLCSTRGGFRELSADERENLLIDAGHSRRSILTALYDAHVVHRQRSETLEYLGGLEKSRYIGPRERVLIMKESAVRKLERTCKGTSTVKEQRKLWENANGSVVELRD